MAARNALYVGAVAPVSTVYDLTTDDPAFDLTTASAADLHVWFENDDEADWSCSLSPIPPDGAIGAGRLRLTRLHQSADLPEGSEGTIRVQPRVTIPASAEPIRGEVRAIPVERAGT